MSNVDEVRELIQQAAAEAAESGVAVTAEYVDKSVLYDDDGDMQERRDIEVRVRVVPPVKSPFN